MEVDGVPRARSGVAFAFAAGARCIAPVVASDALRVARHTERLDELVRFHPDGLGLREIGGFHNHNGYDGVFLKVPGSVAHLELTAGGEHGAPVPDPESLPVLYLGDQDAVEKVVARLGINPVVPATPYLAEHGITVADPDGFRIVLAPEHWQSREIWIAWAVPQLVLRSRRALHNC